MDLSLGAFVSGVELLLIRYLTRRHERAKHHEENSNAFLPRMKRRWTQINAINEGEGKAIRLLLSYLRPSAFICGKNAFEFPSRFLRGFGASVKPILSCELKGVYRGNDPLAM